jgi:peptidoglycan/xylan/chitin deacetylase (PgdA/CDA1 family)
MSVLRTTAKEMIRKVVDWSPFRSQILFRRCDAQRAIALTFDDGPHPDHTPALLDLLAEHRARATFFLVGNRARGHPDLIRRIASEGHAIGNHSYSHIDCSVLPYEKVLEELNETDHIIQDAGVRPTKLFRPPWGRLTLRQMWRLVREGRQLVYWSLKSDDHILEPPEIISKCLPAKSREILLFHDGNANTRAALPRLLKSYADAGLTTLPLAEPQLIAATNPTAL